MSNIIDLSGTIEHGLWGYHALPGLENIVPVVEVKTIATVQEHEFFASKIVMSTISGTYLEAGAHILEQGKCLDEYTVEDFIKPAKVIHVPKQQPKGIVTAEMLQTHAPRIHRGEALLIDTGWGAMWNKPGYVLDSPNYSKSALEWILAQGISLLGVDVTCIEAAWSEDEAAEKGSLLGQLFQSGALLVAPLINLERITTEAGRIMCLPLKLKGTSGAPARVIFFEEEN
jgi:arylformamidase